MVKKFPIQKLIPTALTFFTVHEWWEISAYFGLTLLQSLNVKLFLHSTYERRLKNHHFIIFLSTSSSLGVKRKKEKHWNVYDNNPRRRKMRTLKVQVENQIITILRSNIFDRVWVKSFSFLTSVREESL